MHNLHMAALPLAGRSSDHLVAFYRNDDFLVERVASFVSEGIASGDQVIVMATLAHWNAVATRLEKNNISYGRAVADRRLVLLDAEEVLQSISVEGRASIDGFSAPLQSLIRKGTPQRICGELASLLAERGDLETAIAIEPLGHELAHTYGIPVLCGYRTGGEKPLSPGEVASVKAVHDRSLFEGRPAPHLERQAGKDAASGFHAVRFYENWESLARTAGRFLGEGFVAGMPAIVAATPEHRNLIRQVLAQHYFDVGRLEAAGDLTMVDAAETLSRFMCDGMPDSVKFRHTVIPVIEQLRRGRPDCVIHAFGEMVDVLWKAGQTSAAIRLEMLWNQLARTYSLAILCGYSKGHFYKDAAQHDIRRQHTHLVSDSGEPITLR